MTEPPKPPLLLIGGVALPEPAPGLADSVAVIMRTKNRARLLQRALASVLGQTHPVWRLYLVNDGGDPAGLDQAIAPHRAALADRLTLIHLPTSCGMEAASNAGLAQAREAFAVVHDDDDSWHPDFLAATTQFLADPAHRTCVGVTTGCTLITERLHDDRIEEVARLPWPHNRKLTDFAELLVSNRIPSISLLFRRAAIDRIGMFNPDLPVLGDWEFNIRLLTLGEIDFLDRDLANYHQRAAGATGDYGNTVTGDQSLHIRTNLLLRNAILRTAITSEPALLGAVQTLLNALQPAATPMDAIAQRLTAIEVRQNDLTYRLGEIGLLASRLNKMLRPVIWLWRQLMPLRRFIVRARGR